MKDDLTDLYMEAVRNPKKTDASKNDKDSKKGIVGKVDEDGDFGFSKKGVQKGTGPGAVKGIEKPKKAAKTLTEDSDMDTKIGSKFDDLFSQTISEEFGEAGPGGMPDMSDSSADDSAPGGMPEDGMDPDDTGDEVSLKAELRTLADRLMEIIDNIEGDDDENADVDNDGDLEDGGIEGMDTSSNHRPFGEASANAQGKGEAGMDSKRDGVMRKAKDFDKGLQGKNNKVSGYYGNKTMKGQAGETGMTKPRDGVLRKAPDFDKGLQGKNNKVNTSSIMSKPGASLFD